MLRILSSIALAIVPALAIIVFICLLSSRVDIAVVTNSIRMDVESGAVDYPTDWNMRTGAIDWADCIALAIATYGENDVVSVLAGRGNRLFPGAMHTCEQLRIKSADHLNDKRMRFKIIGAIGGGQYPF